MTFADKLRQNIKDGPQNMTAAGEKIKKKFFGIQSKEPQKEETKPEPEPESESK